MSGRCLVMHRCQSLNPPVAEIGGNYEKKYFFILGIIFSLYFFGCDNGTSNPGSNKEPEIVTSLRITNHSSYALFFVGYISVDFGNIGIGLSKTMNVLANSA